MFRLPIRYSLTTALALGLAVILTAGPATARIPIDQDDLLEDAA
jgi:hypothetical protein